MKHSPFLAALLLTTLAYSADLSPIAQPDLKSPLSSEWLVKHGSWDIKDGVMTISELTQNKHAAVLWHQVPLQSGAVDCEFMFDGGKVFILGCDGESHIGRVTIAPKSMLITDDSTAVKGKSPGTKLANAALDLKPGQWYALHYEWSGNRMAAKVGDVSIEGTNDNLGKKKSRWWFAVGGHFVKVRNVKVAGAKS
ncbi:MAG: hypothetical protein JNM99_11035 [Verrucomicrobiaceae bacterium]|nr:hypothetical protein [Verrucomicrobiaceae bacterium]